MTIIIIVEAFPNDVNFSNNVLSGPTGPSSGFMRVIIEIATRNKQVSKIPGIIEDSDVNIILAGNGNKNNFNLEYLPEEFLLEPNKIIFTSGKDGFLKTGMPIAETYLNKDNKIKIKSLTDPQQASIVHVTKGQFKN